jgi:hypothetical protein
LLPAPPEIKKSRKGASNGKASNGKSTGSVLDLGQLGEAWAKLPENVKAKIVAMVSTAAKGGCVAR